MSPQYGNTAWNPKSSVDRVLLHLFKGFLPSTRNVKFVFLRVRRDSL